MKDVGVEEGVRETDGDRHKGSEGVGSRGKRAGDTREC